MKSDQDIVCANCKYCSEPLHLNLVAWCHRYPPVFVNDDAGGDWIFTKVYLSGWCGEFEPVEEE